MEDEKYPESPIDYSEKLAEKAANCVADSKDKRGNLVLNILEGHRDKVSETLKKMKNHDIVKAVLDNPEEAFKFCFKPTGNKNEYKVNFRPIDWRLLGLGHFKEITEQFNQVQVVGKKETRIGTLDANAHPNKPGYSDKKGYLSIRNGDTVRLVENEDENKEEALKAKRESFAKESKLKNESYIKLLKENPDLYKEESYDYAGGTLDYKKWSSTNVGNYYENLKIPPSLPDYDRRKQVLERALWAVSHGDTLHAGHCTDWVSRVYGHNADFGPTVYNAIIPVENGYRVSRPAGLYEINKIQPGDYLMAENGNSKAGTHGMIALENYGDGRVKVASYGGDGRAPKIEVYNFLSGLD
ncbi:hypothetical protein CSB37_04125, partial [bacterium DOLZORAL124_38_8]